MDVKLTSLMDARRVAFTQSGLDINSALFHDDAHGKARLSHLPGCLRALFQSCSLFQAHFLRIGYVLPSPAMKTIFL